MLTDKIEPETGIALLCDSNGKIIKVIRDDLGLEELIFPGQSFVSAVDSDSRLKARNFLGSLRYQKASFGWELNIPVNDRILSLNFAGGNTGDNLLIFGAKSREGIERFYEELLKINNEQLNALRAAFKDQAMLEKVVNQADKNLYDELSRLNNELSNTQRELAKKNIELEKLNKQKNMFLSIAAHDLRSPLGVILTYSEFLADETGELLNEEHREFLGIIHDSSHFMLNLINNLLDVSKIEAGKFEIELEPSNLKELIQKNIKLNKEPADKKNIEISYSSDDLPLISLDPQKMRQVMNNLISNAIKFSRPGSLVKISSVCRGNEVLISVKDQGQGIPEHERENIFNPFVKTSVKSTAGEKSTGLGLSIVKKIIEAHKGKIWLESEVGNGTAFYISLPLKSEFA